MRAFIWFLTAAMAVLCLSCWVIAECGMKWYGYPDNGAPLPGFTSLVLRPHGWLLFLPFPWVIYSAVLSFRRRVSARAAFIFTGTIAFAMTSVVCAVVVAMCLPLLPLKVGH